METLKYLWHSRVRRGPWEQCYGKQLELDQIVGCSTIFSYKATQTPKHSSYTTEKEAKETWAICAFY